MRRRFPQAPAGDGPDLMGRFTFEAGQVGGFCAASCGSSQHTLPVGPSQFNQDPLPVDQLRLFLRRNEPVL